MNQLDPNKNGLPKSGIVIAGGGTAGHLLPGLAVAEELQKSGWKKDQIVFIGSGRGLEKELVPASGYRLWALTGRGLNGRRISLANLWNFAGICWAILKATWILARLRPRAVLSLGGYAALPGALGAVILRVPLVLAEQNAVASATNRLLKNFAKAAAVPNAGTGLKNEVVTGNPRVGVRSPSFGSEK